MGAPPCVPPPRTAPAPPAPSPPAARPGPDIWSVPPLWRGETAACLGGGPSLTRDQVDACRGRARLIAINDALFLAPSADLHYVCDWRWHQWHRDEPGLVEFAGLKVTLDRTLAGAVPGWKLIENDDGNGRDGLSDRRTAVKTGRNSGYQVINLAVHLGVRRILLLGYDMRAEPGRTHWFGDHPVQTNPTIYARTMLPGFATLVEPLKALGVEVVNCTPGSALGVFPGVGVEEALNAHRLQPGPA